MLGDPKRDMKTKNKNYLQRKEGSRNQECLVVESNTHP